MERFNEIKKSTREEVAQKVLDKHEGRIELVGDYVNSQTKALFHCNKCGNEWEATPNSVLGGTGCPKCGIINRSKNKIKTQDNIEKEVLDTTKGKIKLIGNYIDSTTKTLFHCNICGNEWMNTPSHILQGRGCPKCSGRDKKSQDQITQEILDAHNGDISIIGEYLGANIKSLFHCNVCGNDWEARPSKILGGGGCPRCNRENRKSSEQDIIDKIENIHNGKISLVGSCNGSSKNSLFHCNICGTEWYTRPIDIIKGRGCPKCSREKASNSRRISKDEIEKRLQDMHNGTIELVGSYEITHDRTLFHCNNCGKEWEATLTSVLRGNGCPHCKGEKISNKRRDSIESVKNKIYKVWGDKISLIGDYKSTNTKTLFHCNSCGNEWKTKPSSIIQGHGCPNCSPSSKGEEGIKEWLENNWDKSDWVKEKHFADLKGIGNRFLRFDFYIPSKNLCIEMQGIQHYIPVTRFGGEATFIKQQEHDNRKKQYCQEHGMNLLEIRHDEMDMIDDILEKALKS